MTPSRVATALAAVAAGALAVAWLSWRIASSFGDDAALALLRESGASVEYDRGAGRLEVGIASGSAGGDALAAAATLKNLQSLVLRGGGVGDDALLKLAPLADARGLHSLTIAETSITAAGLRHLAALRIRALVLVRNDRVVASDLARVSNLRALDVLTLYDRHATSDTIARLETELAPCRVVLRD